MKDLNRLNPYRQTADELRLYGTIGNAGNGIFKVFVKGKSFICIASNGGGWDHVSISPGSNRKNGCPTWDEMCAIKDMFFEPEEVAVQYHPSKSQYVNISPNCLHLWRPNTAPMIMPPKGFV